MNSNFWWKNKVQNLEEENLKKLKRKKCDTCIQLMQVNKYHNSISEPAVRKVVSKPTEQDQLTKIHKTLVENETRRLIEAAHKFMRSAKREQLTFEDLEYALKYIGVRDICLTYHPPQQDPVLKGDTMIYKPASFMENQFKSISTIFQKPAIEARWIYVNGKVPRTEENIHIKRKKQSNEVKQEESKDSNKFSIIYDQPFNLLVRDEEDLYKRITQALDKDILPTLQQSNLNNIFSYVMSYLLQSNLSDTKIQFLIELLKNRNTLLIIEHHLHQILAVLKRYRGSLMWEVGIQIAALVSVWGMKYKGLYEEVVGPANNYQDKIRRLGTCAYLKIPIEVDAPILEKDVADGVPYALEYRQILNGCVSRLKQPQAHSEFLEEGLVGLQADHFLLTML